MSETSSMQDAPPLAPEDQARANVYGLLARLFHAAPDAQLLGELLNAAAGSGGDEAGEAGAGELDRAWRDVLEASRTAFPAMLEAEHTTLFVGTGKSEVTPYLSQYVMRHESDTPLSELRGALLRLGISRRVGVPEYEDHIACVFETMGYLIAVQRRSLEEQKAFFERFVYAGATAFCNAVTASAHATFYGLVARYALRFIEIEQKAFTMLG